jgi:hypothetical protein
MDVGGRFRAPATLPLGTEPPVPIEYEAVWVPQNGNFQSYYVKLRKVHGLVGRSTLSVYAYVLIAKDNFYLIRHFATRSI